MSYTPTFISSCLAVKQVSEKSGTFHVSYYDKPVNYSLFSGWRRADAVILLTNFFYSLDMKNDLPEKGNIFFNPRTALIHVISVSEHFDSERYFRYVGRNGRECYVDKRVLIGGIALHENIAFRVFTRIYTAKNGNAFRILKGKDYICDHCGENILNGNNPIIAQDNFVFCCDDCARSAGYSVCSSCGRWTDDTVETRDGDRICENCFDSDYVTCEHCGEVLKEDDALYIHGDHYCDDDCARSAGYVQCADCGDWVYEDDAYYDEGDDVYLCDRCYSAHNTRIHDYGYKPAPVFFRHTTDVPGSTLYFGSETEVAFDSRSDREYAIDEIYSKPALVSTMYLKYDASLPSGRSFEAVSHPLSLDYIHNNLNVFSDFFDAVSERDMDEARCGGHIHISRRSISEGQETAMELFFFKYSSELEKIAGRSMNGYCKPIVKETYENLEEYKADSCDYSRYRALNWQNKDTVEIRIFAVPKTWGEWIANVEFAHGFYQYTKSRKFDGVLSENFLDFLAFMAENIERYPYFAVYKAPLFI